MTNNSNTLSPEWLTVQQAADLLGCSRDLIRRMIRNGDLDARRFGSRAIRIHAGSIPDAGKPLAVVGAR